MKEEKYGDVEIVSSPFVINKKGEVLLITSHKWGDKFLIPGGHIKKGETVLEAAKREGEEELGIELTPKYCVKTGELINSPLFERLAHLVYFHVVCEAKTEKIKLNNELSKFVWINPKKYKEFQLAEGMESTFENYLNGIKINITSHKF